MSGQICGLQSLIRQEYPFAFFFHRAAHRFNLVLCQSVFILPSVKVFFANISAFSTFISLSARRKEFFHSQDIEVPHPGDIRWCYRSRTISGLGYNFYIHYMRMALATMFTFTTRASPLRMQADGKHSNRKGKSNAGL